MKIWIIDPDETCPRTLLKDRIDLMSQGMQPLTALRPCNLIHGEKRLYPRVPCFLLVDYVTHGCAHRSFIKNISADGAFIEFHRPVPTGPELTLVISFLEDQGPVKIMGQRVWTSEKGIGVRFNPVTQHAFDYPPS
jgi:hypothetical protein